MSDRTTWLALKNGDKRALEAIYRQEIDFLLAYGLKFSPDPSLVEDAVHDLFVDLWKQRATLGENDHIRRYLLVALRRRVVRQLEKRRKWDNELAPADQLEFEADLAIDEVLVEQELAGERADALKKAFKALSARQKEAIFLRYFQEMSYQDISTIMEINYQSVRNLVFSGIAALRKYLLLLLWMLWSGFF